MIELRSLLVRGRLCVISCNRKRFSKKLLVTVSLPRIDKRKSEVPKCIENKRGKDDTDNIYIKTIL